EEVGSDGAVRQRTDQRYAELGIKQHHTVAEQRGIIETAQVRRVFNKQDILCFPSYSQGICMSLSIIAVQLRLVEQPVVHSAEHKFLRRWPEERPGESPHGENNLAVY